MRRGWENKVGETKGVFFAENVGRGTLSLSFGMTRGDRGEKKVESLSKY